MMQLTFPLEVPMDKVPKTPHRLLNYEDCKGAIDSLFQDALRTESDLAFLQFLAFAERFSNLSVYNAMLLRVQQPGLTAVATIRKWADIGRCPKPGARPLVILQPFGPVSFVYAMEDTEGRAVDGADSSSLFATGPKSRATYEKIRHTATDQGVRVQETAFGQALAGFAQVGHQITAREVWEKGSAARWDIVVNANLDEPSRLATLTHELGHVYCGHLGGHPDGRWAGRRGLGHAERELEAEAVAWLVCARNEVSPRSAQYLASHARQADLGAISMFAIYDAANRVESRSSAVRKRTSARLKGLANPATTTADA
ncbi:hypothetical protein J2X06_001281 [Lysobacter niastensis]|uniref:IrrE N-terminal-like domain-containing protein n=1 Tax=Lysobacter niastensis TaxID=380629 RepID=A0ABU1W925_9GAMM|nr:ImmA/IrrE family metallo-endopeptidase [Lysobacter niastensis]MDR7134097.1 hypothetical protein [Lysobacter niastensis]